MEKKRVCFPCYGRCQFSNLQEAVDYVQQMRGGLSVYIDHIVMYNIRFRDCLRANGIEGVIQMMISEAPSIALDTEALDYLRQKWTERMHEHIADYDIQCYPKDSWMCIEGCWFRGLDDVDAQVEMAGFPSHSTNKWMSREGYMPNTKGLHIGQILQGYPVFDCYDLSDDRYYTNYIFAKTPLTDDMMEQYCSQVSDHFNSCMVHEHIPAAFLPILYYNGDSNNVLLATAKH